MALTYQPAIGCSRGPTPGLIELRDYVRRRWPQTRDLGIYNPRRKRGGSTWSLHAEGRAWDCGLRWDTPSEHATGNQIEVFLIAHADVLQIQGVFWGDHRWQCNQPRWMVRDRLHWDHLHIERTRTGANCRTPIAELLTPPTLETLTAMPGYVHHIVVPQSTAGIWVLLEDGRVLCHGDAPHHGQITGPMSAPAVQLVATPTGEGYWILGRDGGVFAFGDARFCGSYPGLPALGRQGQRTFGMLIPFNGCHGYSLIASDGAVYQFPG